MIKVAVAAGVALYLFCVVLAAAGFTSIVPLIVIVPVLVLLIGGGNMLGGRSHGRTRAAPPGFDPAPLSSSGPNGPVASARTNGEPDDSPRAGPGNAGTADTAGPGNAGTSDTADAGNAGTTDTAGGENAGTTDAPRDNGGGELGDQE